MISSTWAEPDITLNRRKKIRKKIRRKIISRAIIFWVFFYVCIIFFWCGAREGVNKLYTYFLITTWHERIICKIKVFELLFSKDVSYWSWVISDWVDIWSIIRRKQLLWRVSNFKNKPIILVNKGKNPQLFHEVFFRH